MTKGKRWVGQVVLGAVLAAGWTYAAAVVPAGGAASAGLSMQPSALLSIDLNRSTVVERIVGEWGEALAQSGAGITVEQLRTVLSGMRADHLLAAGLAGNLEGVRNVIANALTAGVPVAYGLIHTKALGDAAADLVYTPVTPCREVDTRPSKGGRVRSATRRPRISRCGLPPTLPRRAARPPTATFRPTRWRWW